MLAPRVAPPNSLRDLRSLRSDNVGESEHEARCARRPSSLRSSPTHKSPPAATAHRADTLAALDEHNERCLAKVGPGGHGRAYEAPRSAGLRGLPVALRRRDGEEFELRAQWRRAAASRPCEGEFRSPPRRPSTAGESTRSVDRLIEAPRTARTHLCLALTHRPRQASNHPRQHPRQLLRHVHHDVVAARHLGQRPAGLAIDLLGEVSERARVPAVGEDVVLLRHAGVCAGQ